MNATDVIAKALELNTGIMNMALEGLSDEDLQKLPNKDSNSAGWLLWHQTRAEDAILSGVTGGPQVWAEGKWHAKFGLPADPQSTGAGQKMDQVRAFKGKKKDLLDYAQAVRERTLASLRRLTPADLDKKLPNPPTPAVERVGDMLSILMVDHFHHCGQICYLRSYLKGSGWLPF